MKGNVVVIRSPSLSKRLEYVNGEFTKCYPTLLLFPCGNEVILLCKSSFSSLEHIPYTNVFELCCPCSKHCPLQSPKLTWVGIQFILWGGRFLEHCSDMSLLIEYVICLNQSINIGLLWSKSVRRKTRRQSRFCYRNT